VIESSFSASICFNHFTDTRHWLSTMAESGGMDELTLANWAGRAKVGDNKKYDHRTEDQKSEEVAGLMIPVYFHFQGY
jgi:hypothetical protein